MRRARTRRRRGRDPGWRGIVEPLARSADGVFAVDASQRIVYWSGAAEKLLEQPAPAMLGNYCYDVVLGSDYEGHPFCRRDCPTIRAVRRGRGVPNFDVGLRRNGGQTWLNVSIVPIPRRVPGGPIAIHLIRDVSTRRRSEELAQATIDTVARFTAESPDAEREAGPHPTPGPSLTAREVEVLRLLAGGLGTRALALELGLREATVRNHIQRLLAKLGVHSRLEAVVHGARHGLI